jgi:hypothetical protein
MQPKPLELLSALVEMNIGHSHALRYVVLATELERNREFEAANAVYREAVSMYVTASPSR